MGSKYLGIVELPDTSALATNAAPAADAQIANKKYVDDSVSSVSPAFGEMHGYENATATVINVVDQYHSVQGILSDDHLMGWTFEAGGEGTGDITTAAAGAAININDVAHGRVDGDILNVQSANHTGTVVVTYVNDDNFTVPIAYVGDETGYWQQGDRLIAGAQAAGWYGFGFSASIKAAANNKTYKFELSKNTTHVDESASEQKVAIGADIGPAASGGIMEIAAGDEITLIVKNVTDATDLTLKHCNVNMARM